MQKVSRVSQKTQTQGSFRTTRTREKECSLFFSLLSRISSKAARVTIRSSSRANPREKENFKRRLSTAHKRTFFILDLRFHVIDGIRRLHFQGDGFARQGFHENLHLLLLRLKYYYACVMCSLCVCFCARDF